MARLVLLNGVPGSGKSTLARRYVDEHPLALALDVDVVRALLGGWMDHQRASGLAARALALAMAGTHLGAGHDVVVPQLLARADFIVQLEALADRLGVPFVEVVLRVSVPVMLARFERRSAEGHRPEHLDAAEVVRRADGEAGLVAVHERLTALVATRPRALVISSVDGRVEETYRRLTQLLDGEQAREGSRGSGR